MKRTHGQDSQAIISKEAETGPHSKQDGSKAHHDITYAYNFWLAILHVHYSFTLHC